jgi:hypothetical protein
MVWIFAFDVLERWADRAGQIAALDVMAGKAIALAAIERDPLPFGGGLGAGGIGRRRATGQ